MKYVSQNTQYFVVNTHSTIHILFSFTSVLLFFSQFFVSYIKGTKGTMLDYKARSTYHLSLLTNRPSHVSYGNAIINNTLTY